MRAVPADRERWLALGLLLAALGLAYLILVHPWWTAPMLDLQQRIDALQQRDLRIRMQLQQQPLIQRRLAEAMALTAQRPGFLVEASAESATAGLVQRLENAVVAASPGNRSCAITNRTPLTETSEDRFRRIVVQVRLRCGSPELSAVLHSLESGSPRLFIEDLNLLASRNFYLAGQGGPQQGGLDISFNLYGYLRPLPGATRAR